MLRTGQDVAAVDEGLYLVAIPGAFVDPDPLTESEVDPRFAPRLNPTLEDTDVSVWVARQDDGSWLAVWGKDAFSGCDVSWQRPDQAWVDPCSGSVYDRAGRLVRGPSVRDLGTFAITVTDDGDLRIDTSRYTSGRDR